MKVSQMPYVRPDKAEVIAKLKDMTQRFKEAKSVDVQVAILHEFCDFSADLRTTMMLAHIRFSQNTSDEFYKKENENNDEILPEISFATVNFLQEIYASAFRAELEKEFTPVFFDRIRSMMTVNNDRLIPLQVEENKLASEYTELTSGLLCTYNGETLPPSEMVKYANNPDKALRKGAYEALGKTYLSVADKLDGIYDELVAVRTKQSKILNMPSYTDFGYATMLRTCYNKEDIAKFRANVKKYFVPLVAEIKKDISVKMNYDKFSYADDSIYTKGCTDPYGTPDEIFELGQRMYDELSPKTSELFHKMREADALDVLSRQGKEGGGYEEELPKYKIPFVLANFNGSRDDIEVLTHEFGHSLAAYLSFDYPYQQLLSMSNETAEVHSMGMEFMTYPWMELFFKDRTEDFKFAHIASAISFIPYGTIVDYFQQEVYDKPEMTPSMRNKLWASLEKEFQPYMDNGGIPFYGDGRRWQRQLHIYLMPFYYIDYCLAQFTALQFFALAKKDRESAFKKYMEFVHLGMTRSFTELIDLCGLKSPFEEDSFKEIVSAIKEELKL